MPHSLQELRESLDHEGFLPSEYSVGPPFRDDTLCLAEEGGGWSIFRYERGRRNPVAQFTELADASAEFLNTLRRGRD